MAADGIQERHQKGCPRATKPPPARCNCVRSYRASIYDKRTKKHSYGPGWQQDKATVVKWRTQALRELEAELTAGTTPAGSSPLLREAWESWYAGAKSGAVPTKGGLRYKRLALESYERAWRLHIGPEFGSRRIGAVTRKELQAWVDGLAAKGMPRSTLNNALDPLRVLFRYALRRSTVASNPTADLELPAAAEDDMRFATKDEAAALITALPAEDQALWASAVYGGLRRGELQALRWSNVDLGTKPAMTVLKSQSGPTTNAPKTKAGVRRVPIVPQLLALLKAHK